MDSENLNNKIDKIDKICQECRLEFTALKTQFEECRLSCKLPEYKITVDKRFKYTNSRIDESKTMIYKLIGILVTLGILSGTVLANVNSNKLSKNDFIEYKEHQKDDRNRWIAQFDKMVSQNQKNQERILSEMSKINVSVATVETELKMLRSGNHHD